jgi:hypothetical protein
MSEHGSHSGDQPRSRRDVVRLGAAGVAGALAAGAFAPGAASANDGDPLIMGSLGNSASAETVLDSTGTYTLSLTNSGNGGALSLTGGKFQVALDASATAAGAPAILAYSAGPCPAILASVNGAGTVQTVDIGVQGSSADSSGAGLLGENTGTGTGVHGTSNGGDGIYAEDTSNATTANGLRATSGAGTAVNAATNTGIAVAAEAGSAGGTALWVSGPAAYSNCGIATVGGSVATPKQSVLVKGVKLSANSLVVATLQASISGVFVASAVPHVTAGTITISLNQAVSQHVKVGWIAIDLIPIGPV